jgi:hypothetical protein
VIATHVLAVSTAAGCSKESAGEWSPNAFEKRGLVLSQRGSIPPLSSIFTPGLPVVRRTVSKAVTRGSNPRPGANGERGRWQASTLLTCQAFTRDWVRFPGSPPQFGCQADMVGRACL